MVAGCHLDTGEERQWATEANRGEHGQGQQVARVASSVCHELFYPLLLFAHWIALLSLFELDRLSLPSQSSLGPCQLRRWDDVVKRKHKWQS